MDETSASNSEAKALSYPSFDAKPSSYGSCESSGTIESLPELSLSSCSTETTNSYDMTYEKLRNQHVSTRRRPYYSVSRRLEVAKVRKIGACSECRSRKIRCKHALQEIDIDAESTSAPHPPHHSPQIGAFEMMDLHPGHYTDPDFNLASRSLSAFIASPGSISTPTRPIDDFPNLRLLSEQDNSGLPIGGIVDSFNWSSLSDFVEPPWDFAKPYSSDSLLIRGSDSSIPYPFNFQPDLNNSSHQHLFTHDIPSKGDTSSSDRDATTDASNDPETGLASDMETDWEEMEGGRDQLYNEICKSNRGKRLTNWETRQNRRQRLLEETKKQKLIDRLMGGFYIIFRKDTTEFRSCASGQDSPSQDSLQGGNNKIDGSSTRATRTKRSTGGGKDDGEEEQEEEDRPPKRLKQVHKSHEDRLPGLKFACPFHQHNPRKYGIDDMLCDANYRSCAGPGFLSIARMKEHLYRRHRMPIRCNRCGVIFKTQEYLKAHVRVLVPCRVQPELPLEGVTEEIEKQLKSRKKTSPYQSDEDRWRAVYHILFPNEEIPCPYYENENAVAAFQEYSNRETPRVFLRMLENRASTNQLTQEIRNELADIVQECRIYVYRQYRQEAVRKPPTAVDEIDAAIPALTSNDSQSDNSNIEAHLQPQGETEGLANYDPADFESIFQDPFGTESNSGFDDLNWGPPAIYQCFCFGSCSCPPFPGSKNPG